MSDEVFAETHVIQIWMTWHSQNVNRTAFYFYACSVFDDRQDSR